MQPRSGRLTEMKHVLTWCSLCALLLWSGASCFVVVPNTTAKALDPGRVELMPYIGGALGVVGGDHGGTVYLGGAARVGVTEWFDLAITADYPTGILADFKFELVDTPSIAFALDPGAGMHWSGTLFQARLGLPFDVVLGDHRLTITPAYRLMIQEAALHIGELSVGAEFELADDLFYLAPLFTGTLWSGNVVALQLSLGFKFRL